MRDHSVGHIDSKVVTGIAGSVCVTKTRSQEPPKAERPYAAGAKIIELLAAAIRSESPVIIVLSRSEEKALS
jgi:hypothetical protein